MKTIIIFTIVLINFIIGNCYGQSGMYKCNYYEFKSEDDPSKNTIETDTKILILDLEALDHKNVMWRLPDPEKKGGGDVFLKWNIKNVTDAKFVKEKNYVQTTYEVKVELSGVEVDRIEYLYKIDDLNNKSITIIIYHPKSNTRQYFYNLVSF